MANEVKLEKVSQQVFGISPRRYRQLAADGIVPQVVNGEIDLLRATRDLLDYYRKLLAGQGSLSLTDERVRLTKINADRKELQLQREKGELIETAIAMQVWGDVVMRMRSKLLSIPTKLAGIAVGHQSPVEVKSVVDKYIEEVLSELSNPDLYKLSAKGVPKAKSQKVKKAK